MTTALGTIVARVVAVLQAVPSVGVVNDFEPYAKREEDFRKYYLDPVLGYVLGWTVARTDTLEAWATDRDSMVTHTLVVRGYRVFGSDTDGATVKDFQDLVEVVRDALRANQRTLYGGDPVRYVGPPVVRSVDARQFSDCLVHYAELAQPCAELVHIARP